MNYDGRFCTQPFLRLLRLARPERVRAEQHPRDTFPRERRLSRIAKVHLLIARYYQTLHDELGVWGVECTASASGKVPFH